MLDMKTAGERIRQLPSVQQAGWMTVCDGIKLALEVQAETLEQAKFMNEAQLSMAVLDTRAGIARMEGHDAG